MESNEEKLICFQLTAMVEMLASIKKTSQTTAIDMLTKQLASMKDELADRTELEDAESMEECIRVSNQPSNQRSAPTRYTSIVKERSRTTEKKTTALKKVEHVMDLKSEVEQTDLVLKKAYSAAFNPEIADEHTPWKTNNDTERLAARAFTPSCSMMHRYTSSVALAVEDFKRHAKYSEYSKRLCRQIVYSDQTRKWEKFSKVDSWRSKHTHILNCVPGKDATIVDNYTHFFNGRINGTPDAFVLQDGRIIGIIEYKRSKEGLTKGQRSTALRQLRGYRYLFNYTVFGVLYDYPDDDHLGYCTMDTSVKEDFEKEVFRAQKNIDIFHVAHRLLKAEFSI